DCVNMSYDITRPQPQLYIAPDFKSLSGALDELAETMAFRRGGTVGLEKALRAKTVTTTMLDSGLQISGTLSAFQSDPHGEPSYLSLQGPSQLSLSGRELQGHGAGYHRDGFGTPLGRLKATGKSACHLTDEDLTKLGFHGKNP